MAVAEVGEGEEISAAQREECQCQRGTMTNDKGVGAAEGSPSTPPPTRWPARRRSSLLRASEIHHRHYPAPVRTRQGSQIQQIQIWSPPTSSANQPIPRTPPTLSLPPFCQARAAIVTGEPCRWTTAVTTSQSSPYTKRQATMAIFPRCCHPSSLRWTLTVTLAVVRQVEGDWEWRR